MCDAVDISKATDGLTYEEKLLVLQLMRELKAAKGAVT